MRLPNRFYQINSLPETDTSDCTDCLRRQMTIKLKTRTSTVARTSIATPITTMSKFRDNISRIDVLLVDSIAPIRASSALVGLFVLIGAGVVVGAAVVVGAVVVGVAVVVGAAVVVGVAVVVGASVLIGHLCPQKKAVVLPTTFPHWLYSLAQNSSVQTS